MTKKTTTKHALVLSIVALTICFTMLLGTTYAWFTDSVSSANNIIKTGTLKIDLLIKKPTDQSYTSLKNSTTNVKAFDYNKWEPGYTSWVNAQVVNQGNLALKYTMRIVPTGTVSKLAEVIDVYYAASEININVAGREESMDQLTKVGTLKDVIDGAAGVVINDRLGVGETDSATIALKMQETAGNEYQDLDLGSDFAIQILATQDTVETDSFDNQYDADAEYPEVTFNLDNSANATTAANNSILTNVYNQIRANTEASDEYYVTIGKYAETIKKVNVNGFEYDADKKLGVSVGNNAFLIFNYFKQENGDVKVAAPVLSMETAAGSAKVVGDTLYLTGDYPGTLTVSSVKYSTTYDELTKNADGSYVYNANRNRQYIANSIESVNANSKIFTKKVVNYNGITAVNYGISPADSFDDGTYGIGFYPSWNQATVQTIDYTIYVVGEGTAYLTYHCVVE